MEEGRKKAMPFKAVWKSDTQWESSQMVEGRLLKKEQESPQMLGMFEVLGRACFKRRPKEAWPRPSEHWTVSWEFWDSGKKRHGSTLKRKLFYLLLFHGLGESTFQGVVPWPGLAGTLVSTQARVPLLLLMRTGFLPISLQNYSDIQAQTVNTFIPWAILQAHANPFVASNRYLLSLSSWGQKSEFKELARSATSESHEEMMCPRPSPGLFSPVHDYFQGPWPFPYICVSVHISLFYKDINNFRPGANLMTFP